MHVAWRVWDRKMDTAIKISTSIYFSSEIDMTIFK